MRQLASDRVRRVPAAAHTFSFFPFFGLIPSAIPDYEISLIGREERVRSGWILCRGDCRGEEGLRAVPMDPAQDEIAGL